MKKMTALALALMMMLSVLALPVLAEESPVGTWYLQTMKHEDQEFNAAAIGYNVEITINEDGTVSMISPVSPDPTAGTWSMENGAITINFEDETSSIATGELADGMLILSDEGTIMIFSAEKEEIEPIELAEVNPNAAVEDFAGEWSCVYVKAGEQVVDVAANLQAFGFESIPGLKIEGTAMTLTGIGSIAMLLGNGLELTYADGALVYSLEITEGMGVSVTANLLQDGMAAVTIEAMGQGFTLYFVKAE